MYISEEKEEQSRSNRSLQDYHRIGSTSVGEVLWIDIKQMQLKTQEALYKRHEGRNSSVQDCYRLVEMAWMAVDMHYHNCYQKIMEYGLLLRIPG